MKSNTPRINTIYICRDAFYCWCPVNTSRNLNTLSLHHLCMCVRVHIYYDHINILRPNCWWSCVSVFVCYSPVMCVLTQQAHGDFFHAPSNNITGLMDLLGFTHNMQQCALWLLFMIAVMKLLCWFADFGVRVMCVFVHVCGSLAASVNPIKRVPWCE